MTRKQLKAIHRRNDIIKIYNVKRNNMKHMKLKERRQIEWDRMKQTRVR